MTANAYANLEFDLVGKVVNLLRLQRHHRDSLLEAAADGALWNSTLTVVPNADTINQYIDTALSGRQLGTVLPFAIVHRSTGKIVGCTRFLRIDPTNRGLEIGNTWLAKSTQRTAVNTEAKYLLLKHAFEFMEFIRVQFTTDELNEASRAAILRIGAKPEGIIRNERIMPDGRKRSSARYSIIDAEWPEVKAALLDKMANR